MKRKLVPRRMQRVRVDGAEILIGDPRFPPNQQRPPLAIKKKPTRTEARILVCGSRDWTDKDTIRKHLLKMIMELGVRYPDVLVISGGASGADTFARELCLEELGLAFAEFSAPWDFFQKAKGNKRAAGPVRNGWMLRWGRPDVVLAFHPYIVNSRGTKNLVEQARVAAWAPLVRIIDTEVKPK